MTRPAISTEEFQQLVGYSELEHSTISAAQALIEYGVAFPAGYLEWASRYNTLAICDELVVYNFLDVVSGFDKAKLVAMSEVYMDPVSGSTYPRMAVFDHEGEPLGKLDPLPLYPDDNGLLLWGEGGGDSYFWNASRADPSDWTIVVTDNEEHWQEFEFGFLEFLVRLLNHSLARPDGDDTDWPWLPAIEECVGREDDLFLWHTPERWRGYFSEKSRREQQQLNFGDLDWVDRFR